MAQLEEATDLNPAHVWVRLPLDAPIYIMTFNTALAQLAEAHGLEP